MSDSLPFSLIAAWVIFFGFVNTHQRHARDFHGASQGYYLALQTSVLVGTLVCFGLLIYYFMQVAWYWPIVLFAGGSLAGGLLFGWLDAKIGLFGMSMLAFVGWPASAVWAYLIIHDIRS
jgi:hypothetical protein